MAAYYLPKWVTAPIKIVQVKATSKSSTNSLMRAAASFLFLAIACGVRLACAGTLQTSESKGIPQYQLARWSLQDGAPADIWAIAQTNDDMLWLGTGSGLYRFDGHTFERPTSPAARSLTRNITALAQTPDGTLWMGFFEGGVSALRDGRIQDFPPDGVIPKGMVFSMTPDQKGRLWVATSGGLIAFDHGRWYPSSHWGLEAKDASWVLCDHHGTLWVGAVDLVWQLPPGKPHFMPTSVEAGRFAVLAEAPNGAIWVSDQNLGTRKVEGPKTNFESSDYLSTIRKVAAKRLWFTPDGAMWGTDANRGGLFQIEKPTATQPKPEVARLDVSTGLTADVAVPGLVDNDGNVWVGTNLGLDRLRQRSVQIPAFEPALHFYDYGWAFGQDGVVYVHSDGNIFAVTPTAVIKQGSLPNEEGFAAVAQNARWSVGTGKLIVRRDGQQVDYPLPARASIEHVRAFALSRRQIPYISIAGAGVYMLADNVWKVVRTNRNEAPVVLTTAPDSDDTLWIGYSDGEVVRVAHGVLQSYGPREGLDVGGITAIAAFPGQVYAVGESGLAWLSGNRFRSLPSDRLGGFSGVTGIARTKGDILWLNGLSGVTRVSQTELDRAVDSPAYGVSYRIIDAQDGLPGVAIQSAPIPTAMGDDANVWLATNAGLARLSDTAIQTSARRPRSTILGIKVNGVDKPPARHLELPARTSNLQFEFAAASLSTPQRIRFRYRLTGADTDWQESKSRQAAYSSLKPGHYRFDVIAANGDGLWSAPATVDMTIAHAFWQTKWFLAACIISTLMALLLFYWYQLHQNTERMRVRVAERYRERERIARELHDTLLQGLQGLVLRLGSITMQLSESSLRKDLESTVGRAEEMLVESRDKVSDLRTETKPTDDLRTALARISEEMTVDNPTRMEVVSNEAIRLSPTAYDDVYRIGREAILNAYRHAKASRILVALDYHPKHFTLHVCDDGIGFDPDQFKQQARRGHWGVSGMQERARRLGARIQFKIEQGTHMKLVVPGTRAFSSGPMLWAIWAILIGRRSRKMTIGI